MFWQKQKWGIVKNYVKVDDLHILIVKIRMNARAGMSLTKWLKSLQND